MAKTLTIRGRKREARRWLLNLEVENLRRRRRIKMNPFVQSGVLWRRDFARLEKHDPELSGVVHQCIADDLAKEVSLTLDEWHRFAHRRAQRCRELLRRREELRRKRPR